MEETQIQKSSNGSKIIVGIIVLAFLVGGYLLFKGGGNSETNTNETATTTGTVIQGNGYTIEQLPDEPSKPTMQVPDLNRPVTVYAGYPVAPEAKTLAESKVASIQIELKKDSKVWSNWISLGIAQKGGGDFIGASLSWKYASFLAPSDFISLANLGNLYAYSIKDNGMAEVYYKQAIAKGPQQAYLYIQLAEVYRDAFSDREKARAIIEEGLTKIPNDQSLLDFKSKQK